jgi:hypothetical protein
MCLTCQAMFGSPYPVCGAKSKRGRECIEKHANGEPCLHSTFNMTSPAKRKMKEAWVKRKNPDVSDDSDSDSDDSEDENLESPRSPANGTRAAKLAKKRAKKARKEKKMAEKTAQKAAETTAAQEGARAARQAKRGIDEAA